MNDKQHLYGSTQDTVCHCPLRPAAFSLSLYQHSGGAEKALVPRPNPAHVYGKTPSTPACQNHRILEKKGQLHPNLPHLCHQDLVLIFWNHKIFKV